MSGLRREEVALLAGISSDYPPGEPDLFHVHLFDVALGTGMRLGELRALRWHRPRPPAHPNRGGIQPQPTQTTENRRRHTIDPALPSVQQALERLAARAFEHGTYASDQLIFQTHTGTPLHPSNHNRRVWEPALRHAKLTNPDGKTTYRIHDLRHTTISRLVAAGADIKLVQTIAGHSTPMITLKRYSHLLDQRLTTAAIQYDPAKTRPVTD